jgi:hypothetical protein
VDVTLFRGTVLQWDVGIGQQIGMHSWSRCDALTLTTQSFLDLTKISAILRWLPYQQRLSRVVEGTGPATPQQPGATAKVLIPAQWGEIRSSIDRPPVVEDSTPKLKSN